MRQVIEEHSILKNFTIYLQESNSGIIITLMLDKKDIMSFDKLNDGGEII